MLFDQFYFYHFQVSEKMQFSSKIDKKDLSRFGEYNAGIEKCVWKMGVCNTQFYWKLCDRKIGMLWYIIHSF